MYLKSSLANPTWGLIAGIALCFNATGAELPDDQPANGDKGPGIDEKDKAPPSSAQKDRAESKDKVFLPTPLAEILRLVKAGMDDDVIVAYINKAPFDYAVESGQIVDLSDLGVSPRVITALLEHRGTGAGPRGYKTATPSRNAASPPEEAMPSTVFIPGPLPVPADVSFPEFFSALAPYGRWLNIPGLGWCWQPSVAMDPNWQPYADNGYWLWSDNGWYWNSSYSWGWAPFHYGRWARRNHFGWLWRPDTEWAPAWVCWRRNGEDRGWAPLPPEAAFGHDGWAFNGSSVGRNFGFDLPGSDFVFVPHDHFADPHWMDFRLEDSSINDIFDQTTVQNFYGLGRNNHVANWTVDGRGAAIRGVPVVDRSLGIGSLADRNLASSSFMNNSSAANAAQMGMFSDSWMAPNGTDLFGADQPLVFASGGGGGGGGGGDFSGPGRDFRFGRNRSRHSHTRDTASTTGSTAASGVTGSAATTRNPTPWLPFGEQPVTGTREPYGVFGSSFQPSPNANPWAPFGTPQASPVGGAWTPFSSGSITPTGNGQNRMTFDDLYPNARLAQGVGRRGTASGRGQGSGSGRFNNRAIASAGMNGNRSAGTAPPYGVFGVPIIPNDGSTPWLPFGTQPASGSPSPYGVFRATSSTANGGSAFAGFGTRNSVPRLNSQGAGGGFRYLPAPPTLPAPRTLPNAPIWPPFSYLAPPYFSGAASARSAPSAASVGGGFHRGNGAWAVGGVGGRGFGGTAVGRGGGGGVGGRSVVGGGAARAGGGGGGGGGGRH